MPSLSGVYNAQNFTDLGVFAVGGRLYTYAPSTTTQKTAFTDSAGLVPHTYTSDGIGGQYIAMNARGELAAPLFLAAGGYDLAYKTAAGVTVWTRRAVGSSDSGDSALTQLAETTGGSLVGFQHTAVNAAVRTVRLKLLDEAITPQDFDNGSRTDNQKIDFAIAAAKLSGRHVDLGDFSYSLTAPVVISSASTLHIFSQGAVFLGPTSGTLTCLLEIKNSTDVAIVGRLSIAGLFNVDLACGVWVHADAGAATTSLIDINSIALSGCRLAYRFGDTAFPDKTISEINVWGGYTYGCPAVIRTEGTQTVVSITSSTLQSDYGTGGAPWQAITQTTVEAIGGYIIINGGEVLHAANVDGNAFSVQPVTSATYSNPYGNISVNNCLVESAARLARSSNPNAIASPTVGLIKIVQCGGYHPANSFPFVETDASFVGDVIIEKCGFYAGVTRTQANITCNNNAANVWCDELSFGVNFLSMLRGIVGGIPHFSSRLLLHVSVPNHSITSGILTTVKYQTINNTNDATRYTTGYSIVTGIFTVPAGGLKDIMVVCGFTPGAVVSTDVYLTVNGSLVDTAITTSGTHNLVAVVQSLVAGGTLRIQVQPTGSNITPSASAFNYFKILARN